MTIPQQTPELPALPHAQPGQGFPLGEPLLYLRAIPDRRGRVISCSVENVYDQQIAVIVPAAGMPAWPTSRGHAELRFVMASPAGAPLLYLTRLGGPFGRWETQIMQVNDSYGRDLGRLRPTAPVAQFSHVDGITFGLEANQRWLGATEVGQGPARAPRNPAPIFDESGTAIAHIHRQELKRGDWGRYRMIFHDYLLDCPRAVPDPLPSLLVAAAFTQHLYAQLPQGTWQAMFPW
ncbi:hypothetical protein [Mycolicibacterium fortuitum]|uniref:hypothetical protein n=1 Tax=Mycolicibacterium fortuitum TaxID=1766 RepID=UPI002608C210|nr:hypothetical protein [Mycolicibacterium fortuitum]